MLLLDTQAFLWAADDSARLGATTRRLIQTAAAVHVSAASVLELTIKSMLGKVRVPDDLDSMIVTQGFVPLAITSRHAAGIANFPSLARHDPFDRLLVAQAEAEGLRLITADRVLLGLGHDWVLDATT